MQASSCAQVFYKIPKKFGCFEEQNGNKSEHTEMPIKTLDRKDIASLNIQEEESIDNK